MAAIKRYSVAKTPKSYDPDGVNAVKGSVVYSETEQWKGSVAYGDSAGGALGTDQLEPTS